jgi:hypothetical protein
MWEDLRNINPILKNWLDEKEQLCSAFVVKRR